MQYTPKTQEEIAAMRLKPEGAYAFDIADAKDGVSKSSGKEMIVLDVNLYDASGSIFQIRDWLVPGTSFGDKKIFEACRCMGLSSKYATGQINAEDFLGRSGWAKVKIGKPQAKKDGSGSFPAKNEIAWYLEAEPKKQATQPTDDQLANIAPTTGSTGGRPTHSPAGPADDDGGDVPFAPATC